MLTHVVLFRFVDPADAVEAQQRLEALVGRIPELQSLAAGRDAVGDASAAHLALLTTHADVEGLRAYQNHPEHQEFGAWLRPRLESRTVVDFEG
jgi:hypothetical protein